MHELSYGAEDPKYLLPRLEYNPKKCSKLPPLHFHPHHVFLMQDHSLCPEHSIDMCVYLCIGMCSDMCIDMCTDKLRGMCKDMFIAGLCTRSLAHMSTNPYALAAGVANFVATVIAVLTV